MPPPPAPQPLVGFGTEGEVGGTSGTEDTGLGTQPAPTHVGCIAEGDGGAGLNTVGASGAGLDGVSKQPAPTHVGCTAVGDGGAGLNGAGFVAVSKQFAPTHVLERVGAG